MSPSLGTTAAHKGITHAGPPINIMRNVHIKLLTVHETCQPLVPRTAADGGGTQLRKGATVRYPFYFDDCFYSHLLL